MNDQTPVPVKARAAHEAPLGWLRTEIDRLFEDFGRPARGIFNFGLNGLTPVPALEMAERTTNIGSPPSFLASKRRMSRSASPTARSRFRERSARRRSARTKGSCSASAATAVSSAGSPCRPTSMPTR